jgi:TonB family protein
MTWMTILNESVWKATILLAAACAAVTLLQRASASLRHYLWAATFAALLGLPIAMLVMPGWAPSPWRAPAAPLRVTVAPARSLAVSHSSRTAPSTGLPTESRLPSILLYVWVAGALTAASRFVVGAVRTSWMLGRAARATYAQAMLAELCRSLGLGSHVRALESAAAPMPFAWGVARPVVVLPEDASTWPTARLRTVLLHELVHVQRRDLLAQVIGQAACSLYWFHPLVWVASRQLRKERERACDDAVLLRGVPAHDYAGHLLDLVRAMAAKRNRWVDAPAMAESSDLESRVKALLDRNRNRSPLSSRLAVAIGALVVATLLPLAAVTAHAQAAMGAIAGIVTDPSGARIPFCRVIAKSLDGANQETTQANHAGEYRFSAIPSGRYALEFTSPGFAMGKQDTVLVTGATARADAALALGTVSETMVIRGQRPTAIPAARPAEPGQSVRVGGSVQAARLIQKVDPVYPAELQQLGVEGTVVMSAVISKNGAILSPKVRNTVDPRLAKAAIEAVRQWTYQPAMLNGEPVETVTTISLDFQLGQ